jgi:cytochrome c oxidase cbb3-type subunit II
MLLQKGGEPPMNIAPFIFVGLLATFSVSWFGYVFRPQVEIGRLSQFTNEITGEVYPIGRSGLAQQGAEVYRAQGCAACHTQQVRAASEGNDLARGWGIRRTVASDFMLDRPAQVGSIRLGPDLANIGLRKSTNDIVWHYKHLIDPKSVPGAEKSNMPPYRYLFHKQRQISARGAITVTTDPGFEYVPWRRCRNRRNRPLRLPVERMRPPPDRPTSPPRRRQPQPQTPPPNES